MNLSRNIGTLFGYIIGATVDYKHIPFISASVTIIFSILFVMLPNTPRFHLRKKQYQVKRNRYSFSMNILSTIVYNCFQFETLESRRCSQVLQRM